MRFRIRAILALAALCVLFAPAAVAQYTTVSASYTGGAGHLVANGTIYWQLVTPARIDTTGGQPLGVPITATVTNGVFSIATLDTSLSDPANPCYAVTIVDNVTGRVLLGAGLANDNIHVNAGGPYGCLQPSGSTWNFDSFIPASPPTALVVAGPTGPSGPGAIASGTTALATSAIASGACQTVTAGSVNSSVASGAAVGNKIVWQPEVSLQTVTGYEVNTGGALSIDAYIPPGGGYVDFNVCNWTGSSITPGALTLAWSVIS